MPVSYTHLDVYKRQALYGLIDGYTQEAGVRNLERAITEVLRKLSLIHI